MKHALPILLAVLDVAAAIVYAYYGEWWRVLYWLAAAMITISTIGMR